MDKNKMTTAIFIYNNFCRMFPDMVSHVIGYERSGSKMITIDMDDGVKLSFLYVSPTNWNLGTRPWRMKPPVEEKKKEKTVAKDLSDDTPTESGGQIDEDIMKNIQTFKVPCCVVDEDAVSKLKEKLNSGLGSSSDDEEADDE